MTCYDKRWAMTDKLQQHEEALAFLQAELSQLSDELYAQQKEIAALRLEIAKLNAKWQASQADSGILHPMDDTPPPHY